MKVLSREVFLSWLVPSCIPRPILPDYVDLYATLSAPVGGFIYSLFDLVVATFRTGLISIGSSSIATDAETEPAPWSGARLATFPGCLLSSLRALVALTVFSGACWLLTSKSQLLLLLRTLSSILWLDETTVSTMAAASCLCCGRLCYPWSSTSDCCLVCSTGPISWSALICYSEAGYRSTTSARTFYLCASAVINSTGCCAMLTFTLAGWRLAFISCIPCML